MGRAALWDARGVKIGQAMFGIIGLHGSSGHPAAIQSFIEELAPGVPCFCPTGRFPDGSGFTFFQRRPDFSIPAADLLRLAAQSLAPGGFLAGFSTEPVLLVGYSSGAIFATALLAVAPASFTGAILLRPQPIADDFTFPKLPATPVLLLSGTHDTRRHPRHGQLLVTQLSQSGATVTHHAFKTGHGWAEDQADLELSKRWLSSASPAA